MIRESRLRLLTSLRVAKLIIEACLFCSNRPMKLLRTFPPLKAKEIIPLAVQFSGDISQELYDAVVRHPWDDTLIIQS